MQPEVLCLVFPLALGAGVLGVRASSAETRSAKLGTAASACGVAGFIPALVGSSIKNSDEVGVIAACGSFTLLLAVAAVTMAVWAARVRRRSGTGSYPVVGLLCGVANLFCGAGVAATGSGVLAQTGGVPWAWRSDAHGFEVTVPTARWTLVPNPNVLAQFSGTRPALAGLVAEVRPAGTDEEYERALAYGRRVKRDMPTANTDERSGPNEHGLNHWIYMGDAKSGDTTYFFGVSITRVRGKAVILMIEAPFRFSTRVAHEQEVRALRTQATLFFGSVNESP